MADKILGNNQVNIYGEVVSEFAFSHEVYVKDSIWCIFR